MPVPQFLRDAGEAPILSAEVDKPLLLLVTIHGAIVGPVFQGDI